MRTYYAFKNKNNQHKQDPDYFVFVPKYSESKEGKLVGKIYKNRNKSGGQYLTIIFFKEEKNYKKEEANLCNQEGSILKTHEER